MLATLIQPPALGARSSLADMLDDWYVAQTKPQGERKLARELLLKGYDYFLPSYDVVDVISGRKRRVNRLAIPGYVFVNGGADARYEAARSYATTKIISVSNQARLSRELAHVARLMETDPRVFSGEFVPVKGQRAIVKIGHAFAGHEAWIDEVKKNVGHVVIVVTTLGRSTSVEIDAEFLEPLN